MKLYPARLARRATLPLFLQISDRVDERGLRPWFSNTLCLRERNDVRSRFFYDAEAINLQLTEYCCFSRAGGSGQYEPFHSCLALAPILQVV
jgi:hypothetical protein